MGDGVCEEWFAETIRSAALCGAYSILSRREPDAAKGLARIAERERRAANALITQNMLSASGPTRDTAGGRLPSGWGCGAMDDKIGDEAHGQASS